MYIYVTCKYYICMVYTEHILNLYFLFTIIKFHKLYQNGENSIVLATIVKKLPLCLIYLLKI